MKLYVDIKNKLPGFNLDIKFETEKDILGLLGASGSGKSMTLQCIAGLVKPDSGKIVLNDRVLFDSEKEINIPIKDRKVGFLFQNYALFPHMTVEQNIGYGLNSFQKMEREKIVQEKIEMMQLKGLGKRYPSQLSGGQQQRVALARALAVNPEVLLLDEPFSALDNHLRHQMIAQMSETLSNYSGVTLFVTHNMEEAYKICNNLLIMSKGKKVEMGNKNDIFNSPSTVPTAELTGCKNICTIKVINSNLVHVPEWDCRLKVSKLITNKATHIGIRAHYLDLLKNEGENLFECWPAYIGDNPFSKIIYLKLHSKPLGKSDYTLQCELSLEEWNKIRNTPLPWKVNINPEKLFFMESKEE